MLTSETLVLLAEEVLDGDLDILKGDVGGSAGPHTLAVHATGADTLTPLDEQQTHAIHAGAAGTHSSGEVVTPDTVGDPLLLTVDDEVLAILAQLGLAGQVSDVTAGVGLGDGKADALVAAQDAGEDAVLEGLGAELDDGRAADAETSDDVPYEAAGAGARQLVRQEKLVEEIPLVGGHRLDAVGGILGRVVDTEQTSEVAATTHLLVDLLGHTLGLVPLGDIGLDLGLYPLTNLGAKGSMSLVEVGGVVL